MVVDDNEQGFGFTRKNEIINGRAAMIGFFMIVVQELVSGKGFLKGIGFLDFLYKFVFNGYSPWTINCRFTDCQCEVCQHFFGTGLLALHPQNTKNRKKNTANACGNLVPQICTVCVLDIQLIFFLIRSNFYMQLVIFACGCFLLLQPLKSIDSDIGRCDLNGYFFLVAHLS